MSWFKPKGLLDRAFEIGIVLKGLDGVAETIGGLLLLAVSANQINHLVHDLTQHELSQDPNDYIATHLLHYTQGLTNSTVTFAAIYLLAHGVVKIVLVAALLRNKLWAYPWMIAVLILFIVYQCYQIALKHSVGLILLTVFDIAIVLLTWREWRKQQRSRDAAPALDTATSGGPRAG